MPLLKILVGDDSRTIRTQLKRMLSDVPCNVLLAADGQEGIRLAVEERPQLMILDIQMPGIDGYAVCQELQRRGSPWNHLPIIFLTSLKLHALRLLGTEMGAYLQKPVRRESLLTAVNGFLSKSDEMVPDNLATAPRPLATP